jgi:hypothetical protein
MKTKTQEKIQLAKMYYNLIIGDCYGHRQLMTYMRLKSELFDSGYEADEQAKKVVFKKFNVKG